MQPSACPAGRTGTGGPSLAAHARLQHAVGQPNPTRTRTPSHSTNRRRQPRPPHPFPAAAETLARATAAMDVANRFRLLDALDGDLTNGALKAALLGAKSSAALDLPAALPGATSSAAIAIPGATDSAVLGLPAPLPGDSSSSSNRGKSVTSQNRHFGRTVDPALQLDPADSDPQGGWTKVRSAKHRAPRVAAVAPAPAPLIPADEPQDELDETQGGPGLRAPRMRDITKWVQVTAAVRAGLSGRVHGHQL